MSTRGDGRPITRCHGLPLWCGWHSTTILILPMERGQRSLRALPLQWLGHRFGIAVPSQASSEPCRAQACDANKEARSVVPAFRIEETAGGHDFTCQPAFSVVHGALLGTEASVELDDVQQRAPHRIREPFVLAC